MIGVIFPDLVGTADLRVCPGGLRHAQPPVGADLRVCPGGLRQAQPTVGADLRVCHGGFDGLSHR